jgi:hypothetical protein
MGFDWIGLDWIGGEVAQLRRERVYEGDSARTASKSQILVGLSAAAVEYAFADRAAALLSRGDDDAEDCWRSWAGWRWV